MRDAPSRHRTLRDAIGWSYGLLDSSEQKLFRILSIFVGGFMLEDVAGVVLNRRPEMTRNGMPAHSVPLEIIDSVARLVSNSLIQRHDRPDRPARFSLLETIREFGIEQLEITGELSALRRRHTGYFLALAEQGEHEAGGPSQAEWLGRLDEEHSNLRAALAWSLAAGGEDAAAGAKLAATLWVFWFRRAYLREGSRWIQQAYSVCPETDLLLRARLLTGDGSLARMLGDFARSETLLEASAGMWRELKDPEGSAWALSHLGLVKQWLGDLDQGVELLEESLALRKPSGDERSIARSMFNLAVAEDFRQNYRRAAELYEETLAVQGRVGDIWGMGRVHGYFAKVVLRQGDLNRAAKLCEEALHLSTTVGDKWGIGLAQAGFGGIAWAVGDLEKAKDWLGTSLLTFRDVGSRDRVAECLQDLASLSLLSGAETRAVRLSASAEALQKRNGLALWPAVRARRDEDMAVAQARLGSASFRVEWAMGEAMSLESAIDEATEAVRLTRAS
jgi:tetratricopeptide (TPR) repeat protein